MSILTQTPTTVTITLKIERKGAQPKHLVDYLEKKVRQAMEHAQYATPAGSKMLSMEVRVMEPMPCPECGTEAQSIGPIISCPECHATGRIVAQS